MTFHDYLDKTCLVAAEELDVLDFLRNRDFDRIAVRVAKSSLQVIIENSIGKAKKILQYYDCTIIPNESRDALRILHDCEAIDDEMYSALHNAIGFRNTMIHGLKVLEKINRGDFTGIEPLGDIDEHIAGLKNTIK